MQIQKTTDYGRFSRIVGNREYNPTHLKHLASSILKRNMLEANPIIVNEKLEVIDGQHRLKVAEENNLPIYYITIPNGVNLAEVQLLNANLRTWNMYDYLESYIALGNHDYQILKDFCDLYQLPISIAMSLLEGKAIKRKQIEGIHLFKTGQFKIKKVKQATVLAENLNSVKPYVEGLIWRDRNFLTALQVAFEKVGTKKFLKRFAKSSVKLRRQMGVKEYLRSLEDMYNWHLGKNNQVRFF